MKKNGKRIFAFFLVIICVISIVGYAQSEFFILDDENMWRIKNFYKEEINSLDLIVVGSSEVFTGYYPGLAYKEFGITSYPLAHDSASVELWKSELKEIQKRQSPKLILWEVSGSLYDDEENIYNNAQLRQYVDSIPFSTNKLETLHSCKLKDDYFSYIFPIIKYHSVTDRGALNRKKYYDNLGYARLRGISTTTCIDKEKSIEINLEQKESMNSSSEAILTEFLDYCNTENIKNIIFCRFPHKFTEDNEGFVYRKNSCKEIISSYGYKFWDFEKDYQAIGIDLKQDFYNCNHMNVFGAEKMTQYIARNFKEQCGELDRTLNEKQREQWSDTVMVTDRFICFSKTRINDDISEVVSESKIDVFLDE